MKINEVTQPSEKALFEALDRENDTGLRTEDLVKIVKSKDGPWSGPMTGDEFSAHLAEMARKHGVPF
jgi:hypothetical protein